MNDKSWINELKVGDRFVTDHRYDGIIVHTVAKITNKQIVTEKGSRFWKIQGKSADGGLWDRTFMRQITDEIRSQLFRQRMKVMIKNIDVDKLSTGQLERIREAILDR
jgi:hypothetical protein